jgi:hypothetical protein
MADEPKPATLEQLRERLVELQEGWTYCQYIDHYPDCVRERAKFQVQIDRVKARIAELEGKQNAA